MLDKGYGFAIAGLAALGAAATGAIGDAVDMDFDPAIQNVAVSDLVEVDLIVFSNDGDPQPFDSLQALIAWDPAVLELVGAIQDNAEVPFFATGFFTDPDGINDDLTDGDAQFTALAPPGFPNDAPPAPGSVIVTTFQFNALAESDGTLVSLIPALGTFGETRVLLEGDNITGDISGTATVIIGPAPPECGDDGTGDCCTANGSPYCDDLDCCESICAVDAFCCDVEWDATCATAAISDPNCGCPNPACPGEGCCFEDNGTVGCDDDECCNLVCDLDLFCCESSWDGLCATAALENCAISPNVCGDGAGDCCFANGTPGCDDICCCQLVCELDGFCCTTEWDGLCADEARASCDIDCPDCGDPGTGDCCVANGTPLCDDAACCESVCLFDPSCCDTEWDALCAEIAGLDPNCDCIAGGCPGAGCCFESNGTPGCDDEVCCDTVCELDPFCCDTSWDGLCADAAVANCTIDPAACGDGAGDCCFANGTPGCDDICCCQIVCDFDPFCCETEWDATCAVAARDLCDIECPGCGDDALGDCCEPNDTPFCDDALCCDAVCAVDSFCCEVEWDQACADQAREICPICYECGDEPAGDCCQPNGSPACDDEECCEAVCALDSFCCDVEWDSICAASAFNLCNGCVPKLSLEVQDPGSCVSGQVTVEVWMRDLTTGPATGFQAFLAFDDSVLGYKGDESAYTNAPFPLHFQPIATAEVAPGELRLDGSDVFGGPGTDEDSLLATLVFNVIGGNCEFTSVDFDLMQAFMSELSFEGVAIETKLVNSPAIFVDGTPPTIECPDDISTMADASCDGATVNYPDPIAGDDCGDVDVVCVPPSGSFFPVGTTVVNCTATDTCGNTAECSFNVEVTTLSLMEVTVELPTSEPGDRCIHFVLDCDVSVDAVLTFSDHDANPDTPVRATDVIEVDCGTIYTDLCAKDEQHTQWDQTTVSLSGDGTMFIADGVLTLNPGDNDNDGDVDINDATLLVAQFGGPEPDGGCPWDGTRGADYTNNGDVGAEDYSATVPFWLTMSSCICEAGQEAPVATSILASSVRPEIRRRVDLNRDGVIDYLDFEIFEDRNDLPHTLSRALREKAALGASSK